jgi:hypothetical protein
MFPDLNLSRNYKIWFSKDVFISFLYDKIISEGKTKCFVNPKFLASWKLFTNQNPKIRSLPKKFFVIFFFFVYVWGLDSCLGSFQDILIGIVGWMFLKWERFFSIAKTDKQKSFSIIFFYFYRI